MPIEETSKEDLKYADFIRKFANIEHLSHELAYNKHLSSGRFKQVAIIQDNNEIALANVYPVAIKNPSLVCTVLEIPSTDPNIPHKIEVLWRGTHNKGSAIMDLDPISPGFSDYVLGRDAVLAVVNGSIDRLKHHNPESNITVGSYGHSLGGSLAQTFAVDIMEVMIKAKGNFKHINNLTIGVFNSAGVAAKTAHKAAEFEKYLYDKVHKSIRPTINCFFGLNDGDIVQQTGEATILADSNKSNVYLFKEHNDSVINSKLNLKSKLSNISTFSNAIILGVSLVYSMREVATAHTKKHFTVSGEQLQADLKFSIYENSNKEDRKYITSELTNKSALLNHPVIKIIQAVIFYRLTTKENQLNLKKLAPAVTPSSRNNRSKI